jgi:Tol biopolymer transport system component
MRFFLTALAAALAPLALLPAPNSPVLRSRYGGGYMYSYYVPQASSTPWRPAWSPDGKQIAFSMAGSLWRITPGDGVAYELTADGAYDSAPAWSPDGRFIVYTAENSQGVNLRLLNVATGESAALTSGAALNLDPAWSPDGKRLAFVRNEPRGQFHIYVMPIENGRAGELLRITEPNSFGHARLYFGTFDDHIQPAWSPDGSELLLVSNRGISLGSGAIWRAHPEPDCMKNAHMVLREETLYRTEPQWSPDGRRILYSSHRGNQYNNLYVLPVTGGEPYQLTHGDWDHFDPRWSPDGESIAYISNQRGVSDLRVLRTVGGEDRAVEVRRRVYRRPMGTLEVYLKDGASGDPTAARVYLIAADGKTYAPVNAYQRAAVRPEAGDFFHAESHFFVDVPAGEVKIEAVKGPEYTPLSKTAVVAPGGVTQLRVEMRRLIHMNPLGWYSGTDHTHMNYGGNLHNTPENMMFMGRAEDLNMIGEKVCNKDNRIFDWQYFTGTPSALSTPNHILNVGEEYRPPFYGHINLINLTKNLVSPFTTGYEQTAIESIYPSNTDIFRVARKQGAIGGYVHPWSQDPEKSGYAVARGFPVDLALGSFEYLEVLTRASHFTNSSKVWHRALNCGFKITASAGEDSILSLHGTPIMGSSRVYANLGDKLTWTGWLDAIRNGRTFVTNGPLLEFDVDGRIPGGEIHLPDAGGSVDVSAQFHSIVPVDRMEIYFNGAVIATAQPSAGGTAGAIHQRVPVPRSGWFTFRAISDKSHHPVDDIYVVAETSPVYVYCGQQPIRSREDAEYFIRWIDGITRLAEAHPGWRSEAERKHVLDQFAEAKRIFEQRALGR